MVETKPPFRPVKHKQKANNRNTQYSAPNAIRIAVVIDGTLHRTDDCDLTRTTGRRVGV